MFGSSSSFGQSSGSPFGQSAFGQTNNASGNPFTPKPFGSMNPFSSQTGNSIFGSTSTGVFGPTPTPSTPAFGSSSSPSFGTSAPAFGASSSSFGASSVFGQKPVFGGFGSTTQTSPFGSTFQQSQPAFGSNTFGSSAPYGTSSQPSFGATSTPAFGSSSTPAFGSTSTPGFGATSTPAFGSTTFGSTGTTFGVSSTPVFGSGGAFGSSTTNVFGSSAPAFGATSAPAFGATSSPAFGASSTPAFGASSSTPAFGATSTPSFGTSSTPFGASSAPSFSFGVSSGFGQSTSTFGSSPFGTTTSPFGGQSSSFGAQATTPTFGSGGLGQSTFGGQRGGTRIASYTPTTDPDSASGTQPPGKLESISAMPAYKDKSHEELRWEDYQLGDKGGPNPAGQPAATGFGVSTAQSNPFASSSTFGQSSSNPFSTSVSNPFASKPPVFGTSSSPGFSTSSTPNLFGSISSTTTSIFGAPSSSGFGSSSSSSLFSASSSSTFGLSPSPFGSTPAPGTTASFGTGFSFGNTQSSPLFQSTASSLGLTGSTLGQTGSSFGQSSIFNMSSTGTGGNLFSSTPSLPSTNSAFGFGQTTPSLSTPFQATQPAQTSSTFSFGNFGQTQPAGMTGFGGGSSIFGQSFGQSSAMQSSVTVQPVAVTNPFGTLPAMPQMSIGRAGTSPSIQYGISSMPVVEKPAPVRISSVLTSRHLSQRRIKLPVRKYHPKSDVLKVPFFTDGDEEPSNPKADALFIPRENPRALIIRQVEQWPLKANLDRSPPLNGRASSVHENGKTSKEENGTPSNGFVTTTKDKDTSKNGVVEERNNSVRPSLNNGIHHDSANPRGDSYITLTGHRAGEAAIVYEHGADIEAMMPKLRHSDYYTEPRIQELAAKERAEPGFCRRVKNFIVGRHGYGSIKFLGETDVRRLDLESLIQFNNREVIVYMDDSKKPPIGQGLNKPAEVTLLNIKCYDKKTGRQYTEGPKIEKYKEMLKKKAEDQGAEFLSYDPVNGEWKFRVNHFSKYELGNDDDWDINAAAAIF
ncbi:hypothetical protein Ancab_008846 [Ancistrocladus abbreviatus]